jgi:hypothetical protein
MLHFRWVHSPFNKGFVDPDYLEMDRYLHIVDYIPSYCGMFH